MELRNYQEDLVLYITGLVLKDRPEVKQSERLVHDVAAYTLNRLRPRYIMSERGFTRLAAEHLGDTTDGEGLVNLVEVLLLVNRAIDVVRHRRRSEPQAGAQRREGAEELAALYWHNLPYLIGRVVDRSTGRPVLGAAVSLFVNGKQAEQAEPGWQNPYLTNEGTRGFFSFLPKAFRSGAGKRTFNLELAVEHPEYRKASVKRTLQTRGEFGPISGILSEKILNLQTIALTPKAKGR